MVGGRRFLERVWRLAGKVGGKKSAEQADSLERTLHKTVKKVTEDVSGLRFNTAVSSLMIAVNEMEKAQAISKGQFETILQLLAPFAPHMTEELWHGLGNKKSIHVSKWPKYDPKMIADADEEATKRAASNIEEVKKWLAGKEIKKTIVVKGRLVNFVAA
jgi:leucyl-tRNA synthetase